MLTEALVAAAIWLFAWQVARGADEFERGVREAGRLRRTLLGDPQGTSRAFCSQRPAAAQALAPHCALALAWQKNGLYVDLCRDLAALEPQRRPQHFALERYYQVTLHCTYGFAGQTLHLPLLQAELFR